MAWRPCRRAVFSINGLKSHLSLCEFLKTTYVDEKSGIMRSVCVREALMNKILLIVMGSVLVACIAVSGWFYQTNRVALGFMSAHPGLLRESFRKTDDGKRIQKVLSLYEYRPNTLAKMREKKEYIGIIEQYGTLLLKRVNRGSGLYISFCDVKGVPDCPRYGDFLNNVLMSNTQDDILNLNNTVFGYLYDAAGNFHPAYEHSESLLIRRYAQTNTLEKYHITFLIVFFDLLAERSGESHDEFESITWLWENQNVRDVVSDDLVMFNPHNIQLPEALAAVFDDADAYRAALALRDEYPQLTAFLYP